METAASLGGNSAHWQGELFGTWGSIRRGTRHANERHALVHREILNEIDCVVEMLPVVELELDEPPPALLSPVPVLFEHVFDVVWHPTQQPDQVRHLQLDLSQSLAIVRGRRSPDLTEFLVLTPVPPLTILKKIKNTYSATTVWGDGRGQIPYRNILLTCMNEIGLVRQRQDGTMISSFRERRTCNWRTSEAPCRLGDRTAHRWDLSTLRAFS
jgi:hypothetical protein